ncbi:MAG TPA: CsbD family protein [Blastocatellia bacterium]|nr:CsbD family protein [Blastocatellia bacterium]
MWNKDEVKGKGKKIKGEVKDKVGEIIGNPDLEAEGEAERIEGVVQESFGRTRRKIGKIMERVDDEAEKLEKEND